MSRICVALTGSSVGDMIDRATAAVKETPFLEFRLDYLDKPAAALPRFQAFLAENTAATAIATCRRTPNGGSFTGSAAAQLDILVKAAEAGFHIVDIEIESAEAHKKADLQRLRDSPAAMLISWHDFKATGDLDAVYDRIQAFQPDFIKIVPTARTLSDNVTLLRFLERHEDESNLIGMAMGEAGITSRVLGVRSGSLFTFAAATVGEETGPGQIAARTLLDTYRIDEVDAATKVYGVAGHPVGKSLSPLMMNTAFRRETVNAVYLALETTDVADLARLVREIPLHGLSITMPHKQTIMQHLAHTDPLSAKIGAVNTVLRAQDGNLYGFNTDVAGVVGPLEKRLPIAGSKILVLGAGGAARAAVFGLRDKGAEVHILNRTPETAAKLAKQAGAKVIKREALAKATFDVVVNATPIGMKGQKGAQLLSADELQKLQPKVVFDLVYNPVDTPLLKLARQLNIPVITGVEMFIQQGARQFEIWTGKPAPEEEMLRVVVHALRQQAEATATPGPEATAAAVEPPPAAPKPPAAKPAAAKAPAPAKATTKPAAKTAAKTTTKKK
ncbi:shikimate dehydrogenase [Granulicella sp. WH15]|uniref:shikimate dehydrogenase n=1 Tax=Granulicella sp. WH15 TaxID=2602070 RepID=UPI00136685BB|nr:shikimate dehydrogenase [Granulicella sp. WH15]QHN04550.1 shikimate dehydrogenase [Granulicella sp. WH15]